MKYSFWIKTTLFFLVSSVTLFAIGFLFGAFGREDGQDHSLFPAFAGSGAKYTTVIIDAGHGGEDGGASSLAGLVEKDVNLSIALYLRDMLFEKGIKVVMTREDDRLLYDRNTDYEGRKKKLDLAARRAIADSTENAIFISIHMNSFTDPRYSGLQVWYSQNNSDSALLAERIRSENQAKLQSDNKRVTKAATSNINLLHNAKCPAVLVECGFLSNVEEAELFETEEYRKRVASAIASAAESFLNSANNGGV